MSIRGYLVYGAVIALLLGFGYSLWANLNRVRQKQQAQRAFQRRVEIMTGGSTGSLEWRWRTDRPRRGSNGPMHPDPTIQRSLESVGFIPGRLPPEASPFTLRDREGRVHALSDWTGHWVLLNFWTTWCPACRQEMPSMQRLWDRWKAERVVLMGINLQESPGAVESFVREYKLTFPILLDPSGETGTAYGVTGIPETVLIDPRGRSVGKVIGFRDWDAPEVHKLLERLVHSSKEGPT